MQQYGKFFANDETKRIDLGDGEWVDIKAELSVGDWEKIDASMLQYIAEAGNGGTNRQERRRLSRGKSNSEQVANLRIRGAGNIEVLEVLIVAWSFKDVHIDRGTISKLKETYTEKILAAADEEEPTESPLVVPTSGEISP